MVAPAALGQGAERRARLGRSLLASNAIHKPPGNDKARV